MKFSEMPYHRITFESIDEKLKAVSAKFDLAGTFEEQYALYKEADDVMKDLATQSTLAYIRHDIAMDDPFYEAEQDYYDEILPMVQNTMQELEKKLIASPFLDQFRQKLGRMAIANIEMSLKAYDEKVVGLMQQENALVSRYDKIIAGARIEWEGETLNLSLMRKYMMDPDREVRRRACAKVSEFFASVTDEIDEIYDQMVKNRTEQARQLGFPNYVPLGYLRMQRSCYDQRKVEAFRAQVKEFLVPLAEQMHDERRKALGLDHLYFCDELVHLPQGDPAPIGTPEEIMANGKRMYSELSPETAEFFDFMSENELFDVLGRKNKKAGGYMTFIPEYKSPFIFANFNGTSGDTDVLTHECGHAFQGYRVRNAEVSALQGLSMETAEIHSMSMEFFTEKWMDLFYGDRADEYRLIHLQDAIFFIPYGCMVDEFQHIVYANPDMTPQERKAVWSVLEREYKPHLDYDGDKFFGNGGYWQRQGHIFGSPFYYIDYCLAQTCALEFKVKMDRDFAAAWQDYLTLVTVQGKDFEESLECAHLDSPFEPGTLEHIVQGLKL
ncbi:MAG: M3 family oligoendopeptidase [Firmicutes bacterium]|nr:M3 family oligoendopeptidase [Bacillota bacterium]